MLHYSFPADVTMEKRYSNISGSSLGLALTQPLHILKVTDYLLLLLSSTSFKLQSLTLRVSDRATAGC